MVAGAFPFVEATMSCELYASFTRGEFVWPKNFSAELVDLLTRMFAAVPNERITIPEIRQHPWVRGITLEEAAAEATEPEVGALMDMEEPDMMYRSFDPSMAAESGMEDEPQVYRCLEMPEPIKSTEGACTQICTESMQTPLVPAEVMEKVSKTLQSKGWSMESEDNCLIATINGVKVRFMVISEKDGGSTVAVKRLRGCAVEYVNVYASCRGVLSELLSAA